jgi:hypothetical protein
LKVKVYHFETLLVLFIAVTASAQNMMKPAVMKPQAEAPVAPTVTPGAAPTVATPEVAGPNEVYVAPPAGTGTGKAPKSTATPAQQMNPADVYRQLMEIGGANKGSEGGGTSGSGSGGQGSANLNAGNLEDCGAFSSEVKKAVEETKAYRRSCGYAGTSKHIAINDYSANPPFMYLFDGDLKCLKRTAVTYGNGSGQSRPVPCSADGDHMTPPGFHLTATHNGERYNSGNSLLLVGLEGQRSAERNILIHQAANPGTASSWGCSGVSGACLTTVMEFLKVGGLVYNYFGSAPLAPGCGNSSGHGHEHLSCTLDQARSDAASRPNQAPGGSTGTRK